MANTVFSKNLRKLREEKQISQKAAASSLGISQALLSHYEKGIRECGLDFLTRAAEFYEVSADFILGISKNCENNGNICGSVQAYHKNKEEKDKISGCEPKKNGKEYNIYAALYKNLLVNAISYIFDNMKENEYKEISVLSGKYISLSIYCLYKFGIIKEIPTDNQYINMILNGIDIKI